MLTRAAGAAADREFLEADGIASFEDFRIGETGVGHVGVDGVGAVAARSRAAAATDGFVVAEGVVTEEEIVYRALTGGGEVKSAKEGIHNALGSFDVAADNSGQAGGRN